MRLMSMLKHYWLGQSGGPDSSSRVRLGLSLPGYRKKQLKHRTFGTATRRFNHATRVVLGRYQSRMKLANLTTRCLFDIRCRHSVISRNCKSGVKPCSRARIYIDHLECTICPTRTGQQVLQRVCFALMKHEPDSPPHEAPLAN